ncbi:unnamed protein product [Soboliphyme baturini]|uniref:Beta-sarcoglycan n=1 Tax=Soboliphyme baturini TaxID=241478 RepID=A0A183J7F3_9BILA|nr:unnamed protein product [Soboliphyme baturini]
MPSMTLGHGNLRLDGVENFVIVSKTSHRRIFDSSFPNIHLRKNITQVACRVLKTNKVRSPVDKNLSIIVENLSFRGNERVEFRARAIKQGIFNITADKIFVGDARRMPISESPAFSANVLGKRLCACVNTGRLFTVPGNKLCTIQQSLCS